MPESVKAYLDPYLEHISAAAGQVLFRRGEVLRHAYFPLDTILSLHRTGEDGVAQNIIHVGNEGFVDASLVMGGRSAGGTAIVQVAGANLRLKVYLLRRAFSHSVTLERLLLRYLQFQLLQGAQEMACQRFHDDVQRTATCVLRGVERLGEGNPALTIGLMSVLLNAETDKVGAALRKLQAVGAIVARGGRIMIADRTCLVTLACRCYSNERNEMLHLMPLGETASGGTESRHPAAAVAMGDGR